MPAPGSKVSGEAKPPAKFNGTARETTVETSSKQFSTMSNTTGGWPHYVSVEAVECGESPPEPAALPVSSGGASLIHRQSLPAAIGTLTLITDGPADRDVRLCIWGLPGGTVSIEEDFPHVWSVGFVGPVDVAFGVLPGGPAPVVERSLEYSLQFAAVGVLTSAG